MKQSGFPFWNCDGWLTTYLKARVGGKLSVNLGETPIKNQNKGEGKAHVECNLNMQPSL